MKEVVQEDLIQFLQRRLDVMAYTAWEIPKVNVKVVTHHLNIRLKAQLVKQNKINYSPKRQEAFKEEMSKLSQEVFISEVIYP